MECDRWIIVTACMCVVACGKRDKGGQEGPHDSMMTDRGRPCVATFQPSSGARSRAEVARELVAACPKSSSAHVLFAFERMAAGDDQSAEAALGEALELDADWDAGSREHARLLRSWLTSRSPARGSGEGALRMMAAEPVSLRQVMSIPGVTSDYYQGPAIDPRVSGLINGWIDMTSTIASIALSQGNAGGDVMVIPGVTGGYAGDQPFVTVIQEYRPPEVVTVATGSPDVIVVPTGGTVGDEAENCRRRANAICQAELDKAENELFACEDKCFRKHPQDRDKYVACSAICWDAYYQREREIKASCKRELEKCTLYIASLPQTTDGTADPCSHHTDCASCTGSEPCGWCSSSQTCMTGTPEAGAHCASGWQPFPVSCQDPCIGLTTCGACTATECGWCAANASCYVGTPAAPATGACPDSWQPFPAMCQ